MEITIKVYQTGKHTNQHKDFLVKTSLKELRNHFSNFLNQIDFDVFQSPRKGSVETSVFLAKIYMLRILDDLHQDHIFRQISEVEIRETLFEQKMIHLASGRPEKGRIETIHRDINNIIYIWFFVAAVEGKLASKHCWPPVEIQNSSTLLQAGVLNSLNDVEILSIFCSSKEGLERGKNFGLFSSEFESVVEDLRNVYISYQSRGDGVYKPSAVYILREYLISGYWNRTTIDVEFISQIKDQLTISSKSGQYALTPLDEFLIKKNLMSLNGEVVDLEDYFVFLDSIRGKNAGLIKEGRARKANQKYKSLVVNHDDRLIRFNYQLGADYTTEELGTLTYKDLISENLFFTIRRDIKSANQKLFEKFNSDFESEHEEGSFKLLFELISDFIAMESQSKQKSTLKSLKASLGDLSDYLCGYLYKFAKEHNYPILNCSGQSFLNTKLAIAFNDSKFVSGIFERDYGLKIRPVRFQDWLANKKFSKAVLGIKTRHAMSFFDYCESVADQMELKFVNPMLSTKVSSAGLAAKETTKEVFGWVEWLIFTELVTQTLDSLKDYYEKKLAGSEECLTSGVEKAILSGKNFEYIKSVYKIDISITPEMIAGAVRNYEYQYDNIWSKRIDLNSCSFVSCLAAIIVMVNNGIRSHSAINLQHEGLVISRSDVYTAIRVIADKVDPNGFTSHLPNKVIDTIFELRNVLIKLFPSAFAKKREIEQGGSERVFIEGLFGSAANCDEVSVGAVSDFFFYLYNELIRATNLKLGRNVVSEISVLLMPRMEKRGTGINYKKKSLSADLFILSMDVAKELPTELLGKRVSPAVAVVQRPNRTVHSFRASLVTNLSLAGTNPALIKLLTGQEAPTINHYTKATTENLKILEAEGVLGLAKALVEGHGQLAEKKTIEEIRDFVKKGVSSSGGMTCTVADVIDTNDLDKIYKKESRHIAIHATHICPYDDNCPKYVRKMFDNSKDCAICPVSVSFIKDLPAISLKVKYHIDEAQHYQYLENSDVPQYQKNEFNGMWIKHAREASMWIARYELMSSRGKALAGARVLSDAKESLLEFRCEDNHVLSRVLEIMDARGHYQYQSEELKAAARKIFLKVGARFGDIDTKQFSLNPVEAVCRTIEKIMDIHQVTCDDLIKSLSSDVDRDALINTSQLILGVNHE